MNRTTVAPQTPADTRRWTTWAALHAAGAVAVGVLALAWASRGEQVLVVGAALAAMVRGAVQLAAARTAGGVPLARRGAAWVMGGLVALFAGLLSPALAGTVLVAVAVVVPVVLALRSDARADGSRRAATAGAVVVVALVAGGRLLTDLGTVSRVVTVVGAVVAVVAGLSVARSTWQVRQEARRPVPAASAGCGGCACGAGGCGSLR